MWSSKPGISLILGTFIAWTGCALLLPPSWRGRAPLPLAGAVDTTATVASEARVDPASFTDERLLLLVETDRIRLVEITTDGEQPSDRELREIADRLPLLLRELERRGTRLPGSHIRHPVIR